MMRPEIFRAVSELRAALGRAQTEDDVRLLCDVASDLGRELGPGVGAVEHSLRSSIARLEKIRAGR